ncbi:MAG: glycosyltransferase family 2 protein [Ardenticatenaceae bacterium]|nr:glycosyltransferase family 2 protein [Ardenticatenaceae bacterium]
MSHPDLSIIIPMYNEAQVIRRVLESLLEMLTTTLSHISFEIIVVDDGSSDDSAAQVLQLAHPAVHLQQHPYNIGNGAAVKTGIRHAQGAYILLMDADGQHKPEDVPRLLEHMDRYDMVVGARTGESETAVHRDLANAIYNTFASYVCGRKIDDLTSGFRLVRADIAQDIVYMLPNTFSYPTTMTLAVVRSGYSLIYVPIVAPKRVGKSKIKLLRDGSRFFMILFKIATLFSPLKIFVPASIFTFLVGLGYGAYKVIFLNARYGPTSAMLMTISGLIFLIGLVSEQITYLRYSKS